MERTGRSANPALTDPSVPALEVLLGAGAADVIAAGVDVDWPPAGAVASVRQVRYRPGRSVIVEFSVGRSPVLTVTSGDDRLAGAHRFSHDGVEYGWWWHPNDPSLPGLGVVSNREALGEALHDVGLDGRVRRVRIRAYRATRRAVAEVSTPTGRVFVKVVRPDRVEALVSRHAHCVPDVCGPRIVGVARGVGLVVLEPVPGESLRSLLATGARVDWRAVDELASRFGRLPGGGLSPVPSPDRRLRRHRRLLRTLAPDRCSFVDELRADDLLRSEASALVHGDFHAGQVLVDLRPDRAPRIGVVDLDTVGLGEPIQDRAALLGQLAVLAGRDRRYGPALTAISDHWSAHDPPGRLAAWTAAHVVGLATGPFRVQEPGWEGVTIQRLELAETIYRRGIGPSLGAGRTA